MKSQPKWLRSLGSTKNGLFVVNASQRILEQGRGKAAGLLRLRGLEPALLRGD
jgi:hypothetical protein